MRFKVCNKCGLLTALVLMLVFVGCRQDNIELKEEMQRMNERELHYQFNLAVRLGYLKNHNESEYELKITEAEKVLGSLLRSPRKT